MKNFPRLALAILLLGPVTAARAAARPEDNRAYPFVDKALDSLALQIGEIKKCASQAKALKEDFANKKAEIAEENDGAIPAAFDELLAAKQDRFKRSVLTCIALEKGVAGSIDQARTMIRGAEPHNSPGLVQRRERLKSLNSLSVSVLRNLR